MRTLLLAALLGCMASCGLLTNGARTANDIAGDLCRLHFSERPERVEQLERRMGRSLEGVDVCTIVDVLHPFVDALLSAEQMGAQQLQECR